MKNKPLKKKFRRLRWQMRDFFVHKIWGGYKRGGICGIYHWVRCHTIDRYHILTLSGQAGYKWGWIDRDWVIMLACFKALVDFVELEKPFERCDWNADLESQRVAAEIKELYDWWKRGREIEHQQVETLRKSIDLSLAFKQENLEGSPKRVHRFQGIHHPNWKKWMEQQDALERKDDEMLLRLIKIRGFLWT